MGILTNFLKLLKPEENDYYNAITEQAENWQKVDDWAKRIDDSNKKKLDKGNVSTEYDTAKKIEDKIKATQKIADGKVSKTGDTMTGALNINSAQGLVINSELNSATVSAESGYSMLWRSDKKNSNKAGEFIGITENSRAVFRQATGNGATSYNDYEIFHSGNFNPNLKVDKHSDELNTKNKDVVGAINERFWHYGGIDLQENYSTTTKLSEVKENGLFFTHTNTGRFTDRPDDYKGPFTLKNIYYEANNSSEETGRYMLQEYRDVYSIIYVRAISWQGDVGAWSRLMDSQETYKNICGINIDGVVYIQNSGAKKRGEAYLDKTTGKMYICLPTDKNTNEVYDTSITSNFSLLSISENRNKIEYLSERIVTGSCQAGQSGGTNGDKLQFDREIVSVSAIHYGWGAGVSVTCDNVDRYTNFKLGRVTFTARV